MEITDDLNLDRVNSGYTSALDAVHVSDREDADTIQKTKAITIPEPQVATQSLKEKVNAPFVLRLRELVAQILAQFQQMSEKDKLKVAKLEKEYKNKTLSVADWQRDLGWSELKFGALTFASHFLQFIPGANDTDKAIAKAFSDSICPNFGRMWSSDLQAKIGSGNNQCSMLNNQYNVYANAEQSKANDKQQVSGVLDKALQNQSVASRQGG